MVKINRTPPYGDTKINWDRTRLQIEDLLRDYGAIGISWAAYRGTEYLQFIVEVEVQGFKKEIGIQINVPFITQLKGRWEKQRVYNKNQSYRVLYWFVKSKLEAVAYGLNTIEREFLSQVLVPLPDNTTTTIGNVIEDYLAKDALNALPSPRLERKIIEIEPN